MAINYDKEFINSFLKLFIDPQKDTFPFVFIIRYDDRNIDEMHRKCHE